MGWNSWNPFGHNINEVVVRETADALVPTGLDRSIKKIRAISCKSVDKNP
jgi:hypothetical protein